ncbi:ATP-dependent protease [Vibrio phage PWH3a-P1]|uniref:ATP-dependent protease n=1 Tax=Vibrio phage PWH3a-P1 TaxID=754058 RepID=UPI0002C0AC2F|nr:ATP-dependent protease [Vibrio phage PWH3a-P1]AGH31949.1 hypothetical protein VPIG_00091 [Vibrio phage PWH3a-P1]
MEQPVNFIRTQVEVISQKYTIRIDRPLTQASEFQEELATLRIAGPNDCVHILLNGPGGSDVVMKAFLNAMAQSEAHIITEIEGQCCSALTMIFLAGDEFRVSDDSEFMIHTGSFGYSGKENNVREFVEFNAKSNSRLMHKYYKHYLNPEEIDQCIAGKDFWMDADEIMERLENRMKLFQEEEAQFMESLEEDEQLVSVEEMQDWTKEEILAYLSGECDKLVEEAVGSKSYDKSLQIHSEFYKSYNLSSPYSLIVHKDGRLEPSEDDEPFFRFSDIIDELSIKDLKNYADSLDVRYPHNISKNTLAQKLDEKVKLIVDELNQ